MKNESKLFIHDRPLPAKWKRIYWSFKCFFMDIFYEVLLSLINKNKNKLQKKFYVSVCAIFKNEAPYLKEWLEYHLLVGVEHFYLYNNFSDDNYLEILSPYIERGVVDLIDWPVKYGQVLAYEDFAKKYWEDTHWISFIDIDEFICPIYDLSVSQWVRKYEKYPSVMIYWKMFGTSGIIKSSTEKLVLEQYYHCWDKLDDVSKVFFNTDYKVKNFANIHFMEATVSLFGINLIVPAINEFKKFLLYGFHRTGKNELKDITMQINHYWSKSYTEYVNKKSVRGVPFENQPRSWDVFLHHEHYNKSCDYKIWRFLIELKVRMGMAQTNINE